MSHDSYDNKITESRNAIRPSLFATTHTIASADPCGMDSEPSESV